MSWLSPHLHQMVNWELQLGTFSALRTPTKFDNFWKENSKVLSSTTQYIRSSSISTLLWDKSYIQNMEWRVFESTKNPVRLSLSQLAVPTRFVALNVNCRRCWLTDLYRFAIWLTVSRSPWTSSALRTLRDARIWRKNFGSRTSPWCGRKMFCSWGRWCGLRGCHVAFKRKKWRRLSARVMMLAVFMYHLIGYTLYFTVNILPAIMMVSSTPDMMWFLFQEWSRFVIALLVQLYYCATIYLSWTRFSCRSLR